MTTKLEELQRDYHNAKEKLFNAALGSEPVHQTEALRIFCEASDRYHQARYPQHYDVQSIVNRLTQNNGKK